MLSDAKREITAFADFPEAHWPKVWSTNPLMERLNKEVKRRTGVVGIFPNPASLVRLTNWVLIETHDEWLVAEGRYLSEESMAQLTPPAPTAITATNTKLEVTDTDTTRTA
jgi:putative transposase